MKKITLSTLLLALTFVSCKQAEDKALDNSMTTVDSSTVTEVKTSEPMDSAAVRKAWEEYSKPGDVHKMFASEDGTWHEDMTIWMSADDKNPIKAQLVANSKMILGGRYQQTIHRGTVMGEAFEGIGITGYDNAANQVISTWIDNMSTGMMSMRGSFDGNAKVISLKGEVTDPMTGKTKPVREKYIIVDNDTRKMEMFDMGADKKEYKSMEIIMKRKN